MIHVRTSPQEWFEHDIEVARWLPCQHCLTQPASQPEGQPVTKPCERLKVMVRAGQILMTPGGQPKTICHATSATVKVPPGVRLYDLENLNWDLYQLSEEMRQDWVQLGLI